MISLNEKFIINNKTKEEELVGVDYIMYYLDEHLQEDDDEECDCGCDTHHDSSTCCCHDDDMEE